MDKSNDEIAVAQPVMVTIRCLVYNHEPYLRDCLDGFVMQRANFRFEAIVHDDASTDGSAEIIREYAAKYPEIIKPILESENQYSKHDGSLKKMMDAHTRGKYVAFCEGDDYWTDPMKLQKQVDYLEEHQEYSLCCTNYNVCDENNVVLQTFSSKQHDITLDDLLYRNEIGTLTVVFRQKLYNDYNFPIKGLRLGDYPLWLHLVMKGKCQCMEDNTASYRLLQESASHSSNKSKLLLFEYDVLQVIDYYARLTGKKSYVKENVKNRLTHILNSSIYYGYIRLLPFSFYDLLKDYGGYNLRAVVFRLLLSSEFFYKIYNLLKRK